ncbi:hypothetical protein [Xanthomonas campestris]|uniref:hypothetical protein n=1 Tax=Xanthomonas campestris TaxID=339 RepID=UPI001C84E961|nr:hypothetical protein [Xanthomonas campestris]MCC5051248.1 hypothetical protein [Xanthomonas campestris pv. aberrans]MEB1125944.1 hypothetical protein [Xanthomonas campestris pv. campestris]
MGGSSKTLAQFCEEIKEGWRDLLLDQKNNHPGHDLKYISAAVLIAFSCAAVGLVGKIFFQQHWLFFFNFMLGGLIVVQALVGLCKSLKKHVLWVFLMFAASVFVFVLSILLA